MDAVTISTQSIIPNGFAQVAQSQGGGQVSFENVLSGLVSNPTVDGTTGTAEKAGETASTDINKLFAELFSMLQGNASTEDIMKKLEGLTDEQANQLIEFVNKILTVISDGKGSKEDVVSNLVKQLTSKDNKSETETAALYQVLSMLGIDADATKKLYETFEQLGNNQGVSKISAVVELIPFTQLEKLINSSSATAPANTYGEVQANQTAQTLNTQQGQTIQQGQNTQQGQNVQQVAEQASVNPQVAQNPEIAKLESALKKLINVAEQKVNPEVKIVSNNVSDEAKSAGSGTEKSADLSAFPSKAVTDVKKAKSNSEFEELLAYSQTAKTAEKPAVQEDSIVKELDVSVQKQISSEITKAISLNDLNSKTKELTVVLKPQELGEVAIKLEKTGEAIKISIVAQNEATQKLIAERLPNLISSLQEINSQVKDVMIVNPNQNTNSFMGSFNLSDSNTGGQNQAKHTGTSFANNQTVSDEKQQQQEFVREGKLWQTA